MPHLILFDIDATLLVTGGAGMRSIARAAREVFGGPWIWDGIDPSGGLDPLILAEGAARNGVSLERAAEEAFRTRYAAILEEEIHSNPAAVRALPGSREAVDALRTLDHAVLGLLTGNYPAGAALKLRAAGFDPAWFPITAFGDEASSRRELGGLALRKLEERSGAPADPGRVVIVGDTPRDVDCARANGFTAFAVATGRHAIEDLVAAGAHVAVKDLTDLAPLLELIGAPAPDLLTRPGRPPPPHSP
jgi:phosphoglycolate phosphatase-like HAD superfamily hydrolase